MAQRSDQAGFDGYPHDTSEENQPCGDLQGDARLLEELTRWLSERGQLDGTAMDLWVQGGVVTLRGQVRDAFQKNLAEDRVKVAQDVRELRNELHVGTDEQGQDAAPPAAGRVVDGGDDGIGGEPGPGALREEPASPAET